MMSQGYADLHLHVLPGLDDGVRTLDAAIEMIAGLTDLGFTELVATPHRDFRRWRYTNAALVESFEAVKAALVAQDLPTELKLGCEYTYGDQFYSEIDEQTATTIADSNYVLLELPEKDFPHAIPQMLFRVSMKGYYPILAHPERCRPFQSDWRALEHLAAGRALVQVSFRSLAGTFGRTIRKTAWRLVTEGVADLVATDCHSPKELKKIVRPVLRSLRDTLAPGDLDSLMRTYPRSLLQVEKG